MSQSQVHAAVAAFLVATAVLAYLNKHTSQSLQPVPAQLSRMSFLHWPGGARLIQGLLCMSFRFLSRCSIRPQEPTAMHSPQRPKCLSHCSMMSGCSPLHLRLIVRGRLHRGRRSTVSLKTALKFRVETHSRAEPYDLTQGSWLLGLWALRVSMAIWT